MPRYALIKEDRNDSVRYLLQDVGTIVVVHKNQDAVHTEIIVPIDASRYDWNQYAASIELTHDIVDGEVKLPGDPPPP